MDDLQKIHNENERLDFNEPNLYYNLNSSHPVEKLKYKMICELVDLRFCNLFNMNLMVKVCKDEKLKHDYELDTENREFFATVNGESEDFIGEKLVYDSILYYKNIYTGEILRRGCRCCDGHKNFKHVGQYIDETGEIIIDKW